MGLFSQLVVGALREGFKDVHTHGSNRIDIKIDDIGRGEVTVRVGDMDGSGECPGVQLEFEHEFSGGRKAIALSAREAELVSRALVCGATQLRPSDRLRTRRRKWQQQTGAR